MVLWSYAVWVKLADLAHYQQQVLRQPFAPVVNLLLTYFIPIAEAAVAGLLIFNYSRPGLWLSLLLLVSFSIYILLILMHFYAKVPCSCGGFISKMSWQHHFMFNLCLIAINTYCLDYLNQNRKEVAEKMH